MKRLFITLALLLAFCAPAMAQHYVTPTMLETIDLAGRIRIVASDPDTTACTLSSPPKFQLWHDTGSGNYVLYGCTSSTWSAVPAAGVGSVSVLPAAAAAYRGVVLYVDGGAGVEDAAYICLKSAGDTYDWVMIAAGGV